MSGLCYERCIWRCHIRRIVNEADKNDYLFIAENTTYGNIIQSALTYHLGLLKILNEWIYNLNKLIIKPFNSSNLIKTYIFEYPMYSDIFYLYKSKKYALTLYNIDLLKTIYPTLTYLEKEKIIKNCTKNIELLTNDILALLNIFKHFQEDNHAKNYIINNANTFSNKKYVYTEYLSRLHIFLTNYYEILSLKP